MKKRWLFYLAAMMICMIGLFPGKSNAEGMEVYRISGTDRYKTAVEISKARFGYSNTAILAYGGNFPDALFAGPLAARHQIPLLLTRKDALPEEVEEELHRLGVENLYLLGSENVISENLSRDLSRDFNVKRLSGKNRHWTALEIIYEDERLIYPGSSPTGGDYTGNILVSSTNFADALSAGPFVGQLGRLSSEAMETQYPKGYYRMAPYGELFSMGWFIIGGTSAVPNDDGGTYRATGGGYRIAGANRYATAVEIAKLYPKSIGKEIDTVVLASGRNFPDALAAAPYVSRLNAALLLTDPNRLPNETRDYIRDNNIKRVIILGGETAVSQGIVDEIYEIDSY